jgi:DNA polymerase III delta prime subunit
VLLRNVLTCLCFVVIEKYTKHARFYLISSYVSKIIPALQSRCTRFRFAPLHEDQVKDRVKYIAELEKCVSLMNGAHVMHIDASC